MRNFVFNLDLTVGINNKSVFRDLVTIFLFYFCFMNYKEQLLKEHSRINTDRIAKAIGSSSKEFKKIIDIIYNEQAPLPQRAAWVLAVVNFNQPQLLTRYITLFIDTVKQFNVDAIKRNIMVVLATKVIPNELQAKLINVCFEFMQSAEETVVVKVHAMQIIANLAKEHPELIGELMLVTEDQLPKNTAAFSARARQVLKELNKWNNSSEIKKKTE